MTTLVELDHHHQDTEKDFAADLELHGGLGDGERDYTARMMAMRM